MDIRMDLLERIFLWLGDVYDAHISERVYKEAFSHDRSREIILSGSGKDFDSDIVEAFVSSEDEFIAIGKRYVDTEKETISLTNR